jgi:DNA-binding NtrC family response regulator
MTTSTPRILVLDDEKLIRWSLKQILSQDGYEVDTAASTDEAVDLCSLKRYGLIFADLEICGDQGRSFYKKLLSRQDGTKLVIVTALAKDQAERELADLVPFEILEKPFDSEAIKDTARRALVPAAPAEGR